MVDGGGKAGRGLQAGQEAPYRVWLANNDMGIKWAIWGQIELRKEPQTRLDA